MVIDPPWPSSGYPKGGENDPACDRCRGNRAQKDCPCVLSNGHHVDFAYPLMSVHELRALPVSSVLESDALVFLWTINKFVRDAFDLLEAWKLKYMFTMAWHKPHGPKPVGYPIYNLEHILEARKGKPEFLDTKGFRIANYWEAPRNYNVASGAWGRQIENCTKPEGFYAEVRRVTPAPRLDVFSRRRIEGFDRWGNESPI